MENNLNFTFDIIWEKESRQRLNLYIQNSTPNKEKRWKGGGENTDTLSFTCKNKKGGAIYGGLCIRFSDNDKIDRLGIMIGPDQDTSHAFFRSITPPKETKFKSAAKFLKKQIHETPSNKAAPIAEHVIDSIITEISTRENAINNFLQGCYDKP